MQTEEINATIEESFLALQSEKKTAAITHGVAVRYSELQKRLFLAQSKVLFFEDKYMTTISDLENRGLPDDAGHEIHEDYVMWNHWKDVLEKVKKKISFLSESGWSG